MFLQSLISSMMVLALIQLSHAQNSSNDIIQAHNNAPAAVGVGQVSRDDKLAAYAKRYARKNIHDCQFVDSRVPYGENIFRGSDASFTATDTVKSWVSEKKYNNYNKNSCANGRQCGHYTQVVWKRSTRIGCARVKCDSGATYIICSYNPPGNIVGKRP